MLCQLYTTHFSKMTSTFAEDYASSRHLFLNAAKEVQKTGLTILFRKYILPVRGPKDEILTIDIVKIFSSNYYNKALIISSGTHGPELFAGSGLQVMLLREIADGKFYIPGDLAVVLIHAVNPFGAAWLRRTNIDNVDLNRNFIPNFNEALVKESDNVNVQHANQIYTEYNQLFHPERLSLWDWPRAQIASLIIKHGYEASRFALTSAQRLFPDGLYYGGRRTTAEVSYIIKTLEEILFPVGHSITKVLHIDIHTGAGSLDSDVLICENSENAQILRRVYGEKKVLIKSDEFDWAVGGSMVRGMPQMIKGVKHVNWISFVHKFGTEQWIKLFMILRAENTYHLQNKWIEHLYLHDSHEDHKDINRYLASREKSDLVRACYPNSNSWRSNVLNKGVRVIHLSLKVLEDGSLSKL